MIGLISSLLMPSQVTLDVSQHHINTGTRWSRDDCAIARAVSQRFSGYVTVDRKGVSIVHPTLGFARYDHDAETFICDFDQGYAVQPRQVHLTRVVA